MEAPLTTGQFLQIAALIGLPVHFFSCVVATFIARRHQAMAWSRVLTLVPVWFVVSVILQVLFWSALPDLPEGAFVLLGFINTPALVGSVVMLAILLLAPRKKVRSLSESSA